MSKPAILDVTEAFEEENKLLKGCIVHLLFPERKVTDDIKTKTEMLREAYRLR